MVHCWSNRRPRPPASSTGCLAGSSGSVTMCQLGKVTGRVSRFERQQGSAFVSEGRARFVMVESKVSHRFVSRRSACGDVLSCCPHGAAVADRNRPKIWTTAHRGKQLLVNHKDLDIDRKRVPCSSQRLRQARGCAVKCSFPCASCDRE